jgi:hypothetical protein
MNISDAVNFIVENRSKGRRKCFQGWNRAQIAVAVSESIDNDGFAFAMAGKRIAGIIIAKPDNEKRTLHIAHALGANGALRALIRAYKQRYDGYQITALRDGKEKRYRTERMVRLIERIA